MKVLALILLVLFILIAFFGAISYLIMASKADDNLLGKNNMMNKNIYKFK